jgi:hypothetical protein
MIKDKTKWRKLSHSDKMKYAQGMRRLNLGYWGYPVSILRAFHLTTREGDDNTTKTFAKHLRKMVNDWRAAGYDIEYCGALEYSPGKGLLHLHGLLRIKGGYFLDGNIHKVRRMLGDKWNKIHNAFVVQITYVKNNQELREYIIKHIMKEYLGEDEDIRNKFLFSKGWMRSGWKQVNDLAKLWALGGLESDGGLSTMYMDKKRWDKINEILQSWAEKKTTTFHGEKCVNMSDYLYMELGHIREIYGSAFEISFNNIETKSKYEYLDY